MNLLAPIGIAGRFHRTGTLSSLYIHGIVHCHRATTYKRGGMCALSLSVVDALVFFFDSIPGQKGFFTVWASKLYFFDRPPAFSIEKIYLYKN